jgi:hypothetical protein
MKLRWNYHRFEDGRWFAGNGKLRIYAVSCDNLNRLVSKYRHCTGVVSQRKDGSISAIIAERSAGK